MDKSSGAVVARVIAQGKAAKVEGTAYLDVKVLDSLKGPKMGQTIRVWDVMVGSSCSLRLDQLAVGSLVAFSLERNRPENRELQDLQGLVVRGTDYLLGSCGEYFRKMNSETDAHAWANRERQRGKGTR